jgi:hypothetical protein
MVRDDGITGRGDDTRVLLQLIVTSEWAKQRNTSLQNPRHLRRCFWDSINALRRKPMERGGRDGSVHRHQSFSTVQKKSNAAQGFGRIPESIEFESAPFHEAEEQAAHASVGLIEVVEHTPALQVATRAAEQDDRQLF